MSIGRYLVAVDAARAGTAVLERATRNAIMIAGEGDMAQLIVRNLDEAVKRKLKRRAARHNRSMEEEVRDILRNAVKHEGSRRGGFGTEAAKLFRGIGLKEPIPELRGYTIKPPEFD
jgi:plasmid stability protein